MLRAMRDPSLIPVQFQCDPDVLRRLDILANQQARTRSGMIRWIVMRAVERELRLSRPARRSPAAEPVAEAATV